MKGRFEENKWVLRLGVQQVSLMPEFHEVRRAITLSN